MAFQLFFMAQCGDGKVYAEYNDRTLQVRALVVENGASKRLSVDAPFDRLGERRRSVVGRGRNARFNLPGPARFDLESRPDGLSTPDGYEFKAILEPL